MHAFYVFMFSTLALAAKVRKPQAQPSTTSLTDAEMQLKVQESERMAAELLKQVEKEKSKMSPQPKKKGNKNKKAKKDAMDKLANQVKKMKVESSEEEETEEDNKKAVAIVQDNSEELKPSVPFLITSQVRAAQWCIVTHLKKLKDHLRQQGKVQANTPWLQVVSHPEFKNLTRKSGPVVARCAKIVTARNIMLHNYEDPESLIGFSQDLTADQIERVEGVIGHSGEYLEELLTFNTKAPLENTSKTNIPLCPSPANSEMTVILLSLNALCQSVYNQLSFELAEYCDTVRERRNEYAHPQDLTGKEAHAMLAQLPEDGYNYDA